MTFPPYPKYKNSGVEWLGEVPEHWTVAALKRGFEITLGKMLQPESDAPRDELRPYLRAANVRWEGVDTSDIKMMWVSERERVQLRLKYGDLLVSEGGDVGRSCIWQSELEECYFQNSVNRVRAKDQHSNRFLFFWLSTIKDGGFVDVLCNKSTIAHFTAEKVAAVPVPFPPLPEQTAIAAFLDHETARIDALVAEQERLIGLLKEKRQAVISHAVTKGLDPRVRRKPSGVEWLGEVPGHWSVLRLEHIAEFINGKAHEPFISDEGSHICVNARFVSTAGESFKMSTENFTPARKGDILMVMSDLPNGRALARAFLVNDSRSYAVNQRVCAIRTHASGDSRYFAYQLNRNPTLLAQDDGSNQTHLSNHDFTKLNLCVPSLTEQAKIADYLDATTKNIDVLASEATRAIDLLRERRTALISAAVTGKVDVRGE